MPRPSLDGVRTHVIITKRQDRILREVAKQTNQTVAQHIRRALDSYVDDIVISVGRLKDVGEQSG